MQESLNEKESTSSAAESQPDPTRASGRATLDRLELQRQWVHQADEEQAEAALNRYAQAAREHLQGGAPKAADSGDVEDSEEEREARSQRLKLQQKCQDIAALMMVDELEDKDLN